MRLILPTAYLPPLEYFFLLPDAEIEACENFPKRTLRNRCTLATQREGVNSETVLLSIPVGKANSKQLTRDVKITYQLAWQQQHWHTIEALYRHTPYFLYYEDYLRPFYEQHYEYLIDFNNELNNTILNLLNNQQPQPDQKTDFRLTTTWHGEQHYDWENSESVLNRLFNFGPEAIL